MRRLLLIGLILLAAALLLPVALVISIRMGTFGTIPGSDDLVRYKNKTASLVYSSDDKLIGKYFIQNRTNVTYDRFPDHLINALVATEDARFFRHEGFDTRSLMRVIIKSILFSDPSSGGGSTISQQLAKNMYGRGNYGFLSLPVNKIREAIIARRLEKTYSKEEILTLYLNTVPFGENLFGIEAAALRYFNKPADQLRIEESAVLVGLLKANTAFNPHLNPEGSRGRRNTVIKQMVKYGYISEIQSDSLCSLPLALDYYNLESSGPADYFLVRVEADARRILEEINPDEGPRWNIEEDGLIIRTTLNHQLQQFANTAYREHLPGMQEKLRTEYGGAQGTEKLRSISDTLDINDVVLHAGMLGMDPLSGAIRTWVGGINFRKYPYDQVLARRQLASAFKPVIYAAALESGMKPCMYLENQPVSLREYPDWNPQNYDQTSGGRFSMACALARSLNLPTINLYLKVGYDRVAELWTRLGFRFRIDDNPSVALGTPEANLWELAVAYSAFANGGYAIEPYLIESITAPDGSVLYRHPAEDPVNRVIADETSQLMGAMLRKAVREGTGTTMGSVYGITSEWAGKTGTSQDYSDAWFGAFNPALVLVARVGAFTPAIRFSHGSNGSGSALALPLVARTLARTQKNPVTADLFVRPFPPLPPELELELMCPDTGKETLLERIIKGIEQEILRQPKTREPVKADTVKPEKKKKRSILDWFRKK